MNESVCIECKFVATKKLGTTSGAEKFDCYCHRFPEKLLVAANHFCGEHKSDKNK